MNNFKCKSGGTSVCLDCEAQGRCMASKKPPLYRAVHIPHILVDAMDCQAGMGNPIVRLNGVDNEHARAMARAWDGAQPDAAPHKWIPLAVDGQTDMFEDIPVPAPRFEPLHRLTDIQIDHVVETNTDDRRKISSPWERRLVRAAIELARNLALSLPEPVADPAPFVQLSLDEHKSFMLGVASWKDCGDFHRGRLSVANEFGGDANQMLDASTQLRHEILKALGRLFEIETLLQNKINAKG